MRQRLVTVRVLGLLIVLLAAPACATLDAILEGAGSAASSTPADGVREALRVGIARAVDALSRSGGYADDAEVRIPLPESLDPLARAMKLIGQRSDVEAFEASLNRAAEAAAPLARDIFVDTITGMTVEDAMKIVQGETHEATDYLRLHAEPRLAEAFAPVVARSLDDVGVTREFNELMDKASTLSSLGLPSFDLGEYVTERGLDGLFTVLAREEMRIRRDPVARTTEILRRWFGA